MTIDLHIHSSYSDGSYSPEELVVLAMKNGLSTIAITDHDTMDGCAIGQAIGQQMGLNVMAGVEISIKYRDSSVHLLGYFGKSITDELDIALQRLQDARSTRNAAILEKLNNLGISINGEELQAVSKQGQSGRPHIAHLLMRKGVVKNMDEAFEKYLGKGGVAYAQRYTLPLHEAIAKIKNAGGLVVLAHPIQLEKSGINLENALSELHDAGLDGVEVYYPTQGRRFRKKITILAKKHNLLITGGSDFHGNIRPGTTLAGGKGFHVPAYLLDAMKEKFCIKTQEVENQLI